MKRLVGTLFFFVALFGWTTSYASKSQLPKPESTNLPTYPERARLAHIAGTVKLWFVLDANGKVTEAGIVNGNPLLRDAALNNVKSWSFRLGSIQPGVRYETEFVYRLDVQQKPGAPKLSVTLKDFRHIEITSELYVETIE